VKKHSTVSLRSAPLRIVIQLIGGAFVPGAAPVS